MKNKKLLVTLLCAGLCCSAISFGACQDNETPTVHTHNWGAWSVTDANKPSKTSTGKATRACSNDGCDAAAKDKEHTLPELTSSDYSKTSDSATCSAGGKITYTYNKNGVNVNFDIDTPVNAEAHNYGDYTYTDGTGHYKVCSNNSDHKTQTEAHDTDGTDGACSNCGYKPATQPEVHEHVWGEWTVAEENIPTAVKPGLATRKCTDKDCNVVDTKTIELPPIASKLYYTLTNDTATCTEAGTATYTYEYDEETSVSFVTASAAKGHDYREAVLVNGVPTSTCSNCGDTAVASLNGTITPSTEKATFFAGGELEYTLSAYSGATGYYTFTYEGEQEIQIAYSYSTLKDGLIEGTATLSATGQKMITVYLESRATCDMKITSAVQTPFAGEIALTYSDTDPSYVTPELSIGLTTVSATYEGINYEFIAPVTGTYTLTCDNSDAVIMLSGVGGDDGILQSPYTFALEAGEKISLVMCCNSETAEYSVQVALNMQGSGTYADPYIITEDMLETNINAILKNGETKYYKIATEGAYLLNCLPLEANGTYPTFVSDEYTAEEYTAEIELAEEKVSVTGWRVNKIVCGADSFIFALTGSGADATDNVQLYVGQVYGLELNPASWVWYYFYYDTSAAFEIGDTIYVDLQACVDGRVDISMLNISSVKLNGQALSTNSETFTMKVTQGEHYLLECVISADTIFTYYINTDKDTEVTTVSRTGGGNVVGTKFEEGSICIWLNYSEGAEKNPHKLNGEGNFELIENDNSYLAVEKSGYYTFTIPTGVTATLNGETALVNGTAYKLVAEDKIIFNNSGAKAMLAYSFTASTGDITNPLLVAEAENNSFIVESGATYYVKANGASDIVLTFDGVTVTHNDTAVTSGLKFALVDGDNIVVVNDGATDVNVSYVTTAVLGSLNNPKTLSVDVSETVAGETYYTLTLTGKNKFTVSLADATPVIVKGVNSMTLQPTNDEYSLYAAIIEYNSEYYVFNKDGKLCKAEKNPTNIYTTQATNAYVATAESTVYEFTEGTYLLHIMKNPGSAAILETMELAGNLTVNEIEVGSEAQGSGSKTDPFVVGNGTFSGTTTEADDMETDLFGGNIQYCLYNATGSGKVTFTGTNTVILLSKVSFDDAFNFETYVYPGVAEQCQLDVAAGDKVYIIVENSNGGAGAYSFNIAFESSENGSKEKPFIIGNGTFSGTTTEADDMETDLFGGNIQYCVYNATEAGKVTFTGTDTVILLSKVSFDDAFNFETYVYPGVAEQCQLDVAVGDKIYIIVENSNGGAGAYSLNIAFVAI